MTTYYFVILAAGLLAFISQIAITRRPVAAQISARGSQFFVPTAVPRENAATRRWTVFDYGAVALLTTFSALRYQVGTDYPMYLRIFTQLDPHLPWLQQIHASQEEFGYTFLSLCIRSMTDWPFAIFWVSSILTVVPAYAAIKRDSKNPTLSLLLYCLLAFYVLPFNVVRQGIAMSINFYANGFIERRKWLFVVLNVIATLFHTTAAVAAVVQFVVHRWNPRLWSVLAVTLAGVVAAGGVLTIPAIASWLTSLNPRYEAYVSTDQAAGIGTYLLIIAQMGLLGFSLWLGRDPTETRWRAYVTVSIFFLLLGTQTIAASRMEYYFGVFLVLLIPNQLAKREHTGSIYVVLVLLAAVYLGFFLSKYGGLLPYATYSGHNT